MNKLIFFLFFFSFLVFGGFEVKGIEAYLVTDNSCSYCTTQPTINYLKKIFLVIHFNVVDYRDDVGRDLIEKYKLRSLPAFIFPLNIRDEVEFGKIANYVEERGDSFILNKNLAGIFLFLDRKKINSKIDIFFSLYDENILDILRILKSFCEDKNLKLDLHLFSGINPYRENSTFELEEIKMILAIKKIYPDKFWSYLFMRLQNIKSSWWPDLMEELNIDYKKVRKLAKSKDIEEIIKRNKILTEELDIKDGVVLLINNVWIFRTFSLNSTDLEKVINY